MARRKRAKRGLVVLDVRTKDKRQTAAKGSKPKAYRKRARR